MSNVIEMKSKVRVVEGASPPSRADEIERFCVRLELAWRRVPNMRLGQLITAAQKHTLASQVALFDEALVEAVEKLAGLP